MKLLYLTTWDFSNEESDGVCKKIYSHINVFEENGYQVDFIYLKDNQILYQKDGIIDAIGTVGSIKKTVAYIKLYKYIKNKQYDYVYNRYGMMDSFYYRVLKCLKKNGAKILVEIPTYPYKGEKNPGLLYTLMFKWDELYMRKIRQIVDRIITYSLDTEIFAIPTINIMNGVDIEKIPMTALRKKKEDTINLLIVALMQPYHGYERLLYGLKEYYNTGGVRNIICHFVGDGPEKKYYKNIVSEYKLENNVVFYGKKGGAELDRIYDMIDIGVCSLGCYKKQIFLSSELKSREYLARGIPFIAGVVLDIKEILEEEMLLEFPNDESVLDIEKIIKFSDSLREIDREKISGKMRKLAKDYISIQATMKPVIDYMKKSKQK